MCRLPTELSLISLIITTLITWGSLLPKLKASFPFAPLIAVINPVQRALKNSPTSQYSLVEVNLKTCSRTTSVKYRAHEETSDVIQSKSVATAARVKRIQIISISFKFKQTNTKTSVTSARASPDQVVPRPDKMGNSRSVKGQMLHSRR